MKSSIYFGRVGHQRMQPRPHNFDYGLFMMYLDLSELPSLFDSFLLWSLGKPSLAWFRREDHAGDPNTPLLDTVRQLIRQETGQQHTGAVRLLTHLRYFGYCMNPVSFYYCWNDADTDLEFIVAEVHNTPWGETHCYVLDCRDVDSSTGAYRFSFDKQFHVSPFMGMNQRYEWSLSTPGDHLSVNMNNYENDEVVFNAAMRLRREEISHLSMARVLCNFPFMTFKVIGAIYWQALRLWIRRTPFFNHPKTYSSEFQQ